MTKIKINTVMAAWSAWEMEGDLGEIITKLQNIIKGNPGYFDFKMDIEIESGYYGDSSTNITITANRLETDKEFKDRMEADNKSKEAKRLKAIRDNEAKKKREKSLYESLKRKFEKEINESNK